MAPKVQQHFEVDAHDTSSQVLSLQRALLRRAELSQV
jgi:hypothetical protein